MATRDKNWASHAIRFASSVRGSEFQWGSTDCLSVTIAAVNLMYPEPKVELPLYDGLRGARDFYAAHGKDAVLEALQAAPVAPRMATCGDILVASNDEEGMPSVSLLLRNAVLTSHRDKGVTLSDVSSISLEDYEIYRPAV